MQQRSQPFFALTALALAVLMLLSPLASAAASFPDTVGLWDAQDVSLLAAAGVLSGEPSGRFDPQGPLTRAQFAALIARTLSLRGATPAPPFTDVPAGYWAATVIEATYHAGILQGVGGGLFQPEQAVSRAEAVTALARALRLTPGGTSLTFADAAAIPAWAVPAVQSTVAAGLVSGYPDGTFRPAVTLDRAEAAHLFALVFRRLHPVARPQGLYLTSYRDHVDVAWQASAGALSYEIQRQAPGGSWATVGSTSDRVWGDYHADPATAYAYRVVAVGIAGLRSEPSDPVHEPTLTPQEGRWNTLEGYSVATRIGLAQAVAGGPGTALGLGGLATSGLPPVAAQVASSGGPTELFSDSPEAATTSEILYQDKASGHLRLYYDHVNATGGPAHFAVFLTDQGSQPVGYQLFSDFETTSGGPMAEGERVAAELLSAPGPILISGTIQPGRTVELDPAVTAMTLPDWASVQGSYDVMVSGPIQVSFAMVAASQGDPYAAFQQHQLPLAQPTDDGGAGRGTFPGAARSFALTLDPGQIESLLLGDGRSDPYLVGRDGITGRSATLAGNYGVLYRLTGSPSVDTALVAVPLGGDYYGAVAADGQVVAAPRTILPSDGSTGFLMAVWKAGQPGEVDWVPPAGSDLPLEVLAIPLDAPPSAP